MPRRDANASPVNQLLVAQEPFATDSQGEESRLERAVEGSINRAIFGSELRLVGVRSAYWRGHCRRHNELNFSHGRGESSGSG